MYYEAYEKIRLPSYGNQWGERYLFRSMGAKCGTCQCRGRFQQLGRTHADDAQNADVGESIELFVPGVGAGDIYKYEIKTKDGGILLKADPYARRRSNLRVRLLWWRT